MIKGTCYNVVRTPVERWGSDYRRSSVTNPYDAMLEEQKKTNILLMQLIELLEQGTKKTGASSKGSRNALSDQEKTDLDYEIDMEWWFMNYGEEALPAKYMCSSSGAPAPNTNPYNKDESTYLFHRLMDFVEEENEAGTHVFKYLGKVWCKRESNARNCFAYVAIEGKEYLRV